MRKPRTRRKTPDAPLTAATIVAAAMALLNEQGFEGVSLRRLAQRLGISAPSLYWHFADKSALLAAVLERIFATGLDSLPAAKHWRDWMRAFGEAMWQASQSTRDFNRLVATTQIGPAQLERTLVRIRAALAHIDMEEAEAMRIQSSVQALVLGWSTFSQAPYASKLGETLDFELLMRENLELLLAGEALKLARGA